MKFYSSIMIALPAGTSNFGSTVAISLSLAGEQSDILVSARHQAHLPKAALFRFHSSLRKAPHVRL